MKVTIRIRVPREIHTAIAQAQEEERNTIQLDPAQYEVKPATDWLPRWATEGLEDTEADTRSIRGIK